MGIVWAIDHFRPYLYGRAFLVKTDHNPLVYLNNTKNKSSRVCRWRLQLSEYKFEIEYKKGVLNTNADALSRVGEVMEEKDAEEGSDRRTRARLRSEAGPSGRKEKVDRWESDA